MTSEGVLPDVAYADVSTLVLAGQEGGASGAHLARTAAPDAQREIEDFQGQRSTRA